MRNKTNTILTLLILLNLISLNVFAQNFNFHSTGLSGHGDEVRSVAFSPDGNTLASGSYDNTIRLWNSSTGAPLNTLTGHTRWVHSVAFSPDGNTLASGSWDNTIRLWNANTGEHLKTLTGDARIYSVTFSPDGKMLASVRRATIRLWNANTGEHLKTLIGHTGSVNSVAFSPDGKTLASGSHDKTIKLWDTHTGELLHTLKGHYNWVNSVAFSPDGHTLASGGQDALGNTLRLWDANTGELLHTLKGHRGGVRSVAFSPDGQTLASASDDKTIRLWNPNIGELLNALTGHSDQVNSVAFSPDGQTLASGSSDSTIRLWNPNTGEHLQNFTGHSGGISDVAFHPDGKTLTTFGYDKTFRLWNPNTGGHLKRLWSGISLKGTYSLVVSPADGKMIATGHDDDTLRLRDANTGELLHTFTGHGGDVYSVAFSPNGKILASASHDETIRLWNPNTGTHLNTLWGHKSWVGTVVFSPDGGMLASGGGDATIRLWNPNTGELLNTLTGHSDQVNSVAFSPDGGMLASGSSDSTIRLWNPNTGELLNTLTGHRGGVNSVAFSPDGGMLASGGGDINWGGDDTIRLWNVSTGGLLKTLTGHTYGVNSVAFHPDGGMLASGGGDRTLRLWELPPTALTITPNPVVPPAIGEQFTLNIGIVAGNNIFRYGFQLGFDPNVLRYVESANGDYLRDAFFATPVVSEGQVTLGATALTTLGKGNGTLATVTFEVVDVTESIIYLSQPTLTDSAEETVPSYVDSTVVEPTLMPSAAIVRLTPIAVTSPAIGEQITFNVDIAGGENVTNYFFSFDHESSALKFISYNEGDYISNGGTGDGRLGTVTFEVLNVQNSTVSTTGYLVAPNGLRFAPNFESAKVIPLILGDVNRDGIVNILDLVVVANNFGQLVSELRNPADVNEDGVVNVIDLVKVAGEMGDGAAAPSVVNRHLASAPTRAEVQQWLTQARQLNLTDAVSQRGIRFLEQLLAALTPKETALLPNYPNPFNPETWIPYQLEESADVALTIYDINGRVVRALALGHQRAGVYHGRSRAAYWDGRNAVGEPVASGVYFYTLSTESTRDSVTAGDFSATRKMLIQK